MRPILSLHIKPEMHKSTHDMATLLSKRLGSEIVLHAVRPFASSSITCDWILYRTDSKIFDHISHHGKIKITPYELYRNTSELAFRRLFYEKLLTSIMLSVITLTLKSEGVKLDESDTDRL
jgi:hypothetical protein